MKFLFAYNFIFNKSTGYYTAAQIGLKKKEDKYPMEMFQEVFLDPENNFDRPMAMFVSKELNLSEVSTDKDIKRIWINIRNMNFFILTCCNDKDEMMKLNDIGLTLLKKYCSLSPNMDLSNLSKRITTIQNAPVIDIDNDFLGFFAGKEKHGYVINLIE